MDEKKPLSSQELQRDEWREEGSPLPEDAAGHTLPASESGLDEERPRGPNPIGGTMLPPD